MFSRPAQFRRRFKLAATALSLSGLIAVAGCTSAVDQAASDGSSAEVTEGGVLRIGDGGDLTPATLFSGALAQATVTGLVYDTLISYPPEGLEPEPSLAESWEVDPDGTSVTLALRPDVTFHDGKPLTSKDVEFSLRTYADPMRAGQLASTAGLITEYNTADPHAITLTLSQPVSNIFDLLDIVPIIDEATMADFDAGTGYNGTGAFRFVEWKPGSTIKFDANENYWDGAPHLDGVEYLIIPDAQTRVSQLRSGQLDLLLSAAPRDAEELASDNHFQVAEQFGVERTWYLGADLQSPGLSDVRVRQAIAYAVDRDRILNDVFQGQGTAGSLPWPEYSPAYDADLNATYNQDIEKAKALVAEVGDIPIIPITYTAGSSDTEAAAQMIQADLAAVGIKTGLKAVDQATNLKNLIGGTYGGLWLMAHTYAQYTPATLPTSAYPFNSKKNTSNFIDPDYQAAVANVWQIVDPTSAEAVAAYEVLNTELLENAFLIELFAAENSLAMGANVHDVDWSKKAELDLSNTYLAQ